MKATRPEVYAAIDSERIYQDIRWNDSTTTTGGIHSLEEWCVYIRSYTNEAMEVLSRGPKQVVDPKALEILRKVTAMGVAAMEQHGAPHRKEVKP